MHHTLALPLATLVLLLPLYSSLQLPRDAVALLSFKSSVDPNNNLPFQTSTSHCLWRGVQCSRNRVTRLVLETLNLTGPVPTRTLATLDQLRILSLKNNLLSGPIPDLSNLTNLKALFLSHNSFSGPFPLSVLFLHRIRTVDLSRNRLSGRIPASLLSLDRLYCFRVSDNRFDGPVPPLNQSSLKIVDFSGNGLFGPVPVTPVLLGVSAAAFDGNPELCGEIVRRECKDGYFFKNAVPWSEATARRGEGGEHLPGSVLPESGSGSAGKVKPRRSSFVVGLAVGGAAVVVGFVAFLVVATNKKKMHNHSKMQKGTAAAAAAADAMEMCWTESVMSNGEGKADRRGAGNELAAAAALPDDKVKRLGRSGCLVFCAGEASVYTLEQLMKASAEMLGKGMVGTTYKAILHNRLIVSVKRLDAAKIVIAGSQSFEQHMENVGRLRHPNLVPLRAYFQAGEERLLVYDYQPNGSLYSLMHGSRSSRAKPLHWTSCLKIAEDVVQGLAYIHQASRLVHGNLKSSNVLLGADFEACLADNCLAFLAEPGDNEDWGHRAPEVRNSNGHLTSKSDIYSFGILLLELLTGKPPLQQPSLSPSELSAWVQSVRKDSSSEEDKHLLLLDIVTACMRSSPEQRPTAWQVLKMIQEVKDSDVEESDLDSSSIW